MTSHRSRRTFCLTTAALLLSSGAAFANPETGGDYSAISDTGTGGYVTVTATSASSPTQLTSVTVVCPYAGFLIANADAQFDLPHANKDSTAALRYAISTTTTANIQGIQRTITSPRADQYNSKVSMSAGMQRFDTCTAGQSVTYRFYAWKYYGLSSTLPTVARQIRLSVIHLRDRY